LERAHEDEAVRSEAELLESARLASEADQPARLPSAAIVRDVVSLSRPRESSGGTARADRVEAQV